MTMSITRDAPAAGAARTTRPALKPTYRAEVVERDGVLLLSERGHVALQGRILARLLPLLDGSHTVDEIVAGLADDHSPEAVHYALLRLRAAGYLVDLDDTVTTEQAAFWSALGLDPCDAQARTQAAAVSVVTVGPQPLPAAPLLRERIAGLGAGRADDLEAADLTIVVAADHLEPALAAVNAAALAAGRPWLLVKPFGALPWIGPLFRPGQTGCWACLEHRLRANREVEAFLQARQKPDTSSAEAPSPFPVARGGVGPSVRAAVRLATLEAARALGGAASQPTLGAVVTLDLLTLGTTTHGLTRRPDCPACGSGPRTLDHQPAPIALESRPKRFTADGGHRVTTPEETLARYNRHVSPITGVVSSIERAPGSTDTIQAYLSAHRTHGRRDTLFHLRRRLGGGSSGKGMSDTQARASALCEALERWSLQHQGDEPRQRASLHQLGDRAVHPNACLLLSEVQYAGRDAWNARDSRYNRVPEPLDEERALDWTPLWSLSEQRLKYLPAEFIYADYPIPPDRPRYAYAESSGGAAGNTVEEAILQGFLELAERDAVSIWWYNRLRRPALDLDTFDEPYIRDLQRAYHVRDRELWLLDLTADLGIPTFGAISRRVGHADERIMRGFGAHFDPRIALLRALTELNQNLALAGPDDAATGDAHPVDDPDARTWAQSATVASQPYLLPSNTPARRRADFPYVPTADLRDDVFRCQSLVEARGLELLALDATRADIGLAVVKVVVPGLRPAWARFAPGRLYDVPVALGWLAHPTPEADLNPQPYVL